MRRGAIGLLAVAACAAALVLPAAGTAAGGSSVTAHQAAALGRQAFLYGFPLLEFLRVRATTTSVRCPDPTGNAPLNAFSNAQAFARPVDRVVVAPNVDTLYSIAQLDLGKGRVVLSHPAMGHRYFVFQLLDPYTNTVRYVGSRTTGQKAGRFAITWTGHPGPRVRGAKVVKVTSRRIWVIGRTLATTKPDQRRALKLMRRYSLAPPGGPRKFARGCKPGKPHRAARLKGLAFLDRLGTALRANPPPKRDKTQLARLAAIGVGPGLRPQDAGLSPDALRAMAAAVNSTAASLPALAKATTLARALANRGWATPPSAIGDYKTDYLTRAVVGQVGLGANTPAEAMYPTAYTDGDGTTLNAAHRYRLVFERGELPPVRAFWSLTVYDGAGYLVANRAHRYAIGSSHPPLHKRRDGSVVVVVSHPKPTERGINWLPAPAHGAFRLALRLYRPRASALSGRWQPPPIARVKP